jgi:hypothetical protein
MTSFMSSQPTCVNNNTGVSLNTLISTSTVPALAEGAAAASLLWDSPVMLRCLWAQGSLCLPDQG